MPRARYTWPIAAHWPPLGGNRRWDVAPDGRFIIIRTAQADAGGSAPSNLILVLNWFEELKRLVPVN